MRGQLQIHDPSKLDRIGLLQALASGEKDELISVLSTIADGGEALGSSVSERVVTLLGHQEPEVVAGAVLALGCMGRSGAQYAEFMMQMLGHPHPVPRGAACEALGQLGPDLAPTTAPGAVANTALHSPEARVKVAGIHALGALKATDQWQVVNILAQQDSAQVSAAALETLNLMMAASAEVESQVGPENKEKLLMDALASKSKKNSALVSLSYLGAKAPPACTNVVVDALGAKDCTTRQAAVAAVASMSEAIVVDKGATDKLKELLKSDDAGVRAASANAFAALGKPAASYADALLPLLKDDAEDESGLAMQIGNGARRLPPQLRRPKSAAVTALGNMGDKANAPKIAEALNDANWEVRMTAAEALASLGEDAKSEASAVTSLLQDDAFPVRGMACLALGAMKDVDALTSLVDAFEDNSHTVRAYAVAAVGELGESAEEQIHEVFKLLNDNIGHVRAQAALALSKMGDVGANYAGVLATMLGDEDPEVRVAVLQALAGMGPQGASLADEVYECIDDSNPAVKQAAVQALEGMGIPQSPFVKDFGRGLGVPVPAIQDDVDLMGLGQYYGAIQQKKGELMAAGKWVDGIL